MSFDVLIWVMYGLGLLCAALLVVIAYYSDGEDQ